MQSAGKLERLRMPVGALFSFPQLVLEIPPAIGNADYLHPRFQNPEGDCHPALKTDDAQTRLDVIVASAALWKGCQPQARLLNPPDISDGDFRAALVGNVVVKRIEVRGRIVAEYDLTRHAWQLSPCGRAVPLYD